MKNKLILIGVIAFLAIIGLSVSACGGGGGGGGGDPEVTVDRIEITNEPDVYTYAFDAQSLDLTGLEVTAYFSDETSVVLESSKYQVSGFTAGIPGEQTITVSYTYKNKKVTATFTVNVMHQNNDISFVFEGFYDEDVDLAGEHDNAIVMWDYESILNVTVRGDYDSYTWYLNGELRWENSNDFEVNGNDVDRVGVNTITAIVYKDDIPYSKTLTFMVVRN